MAAQGIYLWEGVFDNWQDAPEKDGAFNSLQWLDSSVFRVREALEAMQVDQNEISENACGRDYILPLVCAMAQTDGKDLRVLDFGGGLASSFFSVASTLNATDNFEFHVVEGKGVCDKGNEIFPESMRLYFHDEIPKESGEFDIIHAGSSLQYIDDWQGLLASFTALKPRYLILSDILAGNIKPFVTIQNYYGHKIRIRFLNLQELIDEVEKLGFRLLYHSLYVARIFGEEGPLPMNNFPEERRLKYSCQLLFELNPS